MRLIIARHLWGVNGRHEELFPRIRKEGYEAIENGLPGPKDAEQFVTLLRQHGLAYIAQVFTSGRTVGEQVDSLHRLLQEACAFSPLLTNCHSGKDHWPVADMVAFYRETAAIEREIRVPVAHETHRGRCFFNPWTTMAVLDHVPQLRLCCDFSHWVVVCERLLDDAAILRACAERCIHIHARVGYEEGPQVPDPSAPEYRPHLEAHEAWWDMIWNAQQARGLAETTLTPEFGPPAYLHTLPHTRAPVADLWEICNWQAQRQRQRFAARS